METPTRRTRRRLSAHKSVEVLKLLPRPQRPPRPAPAAPAAAPTAAPPPELDQIAAIVKELGRWWA